METTPRAPRDILTDLKQRQADAQAQATPLPADEVTSLHAEFMQAVCDHLDAAEDHLAALHAPVAPAPAPAV